MTFDGIFSSAHSAGRALAVLSADKIDAVLTDLADATEQAVDRLLQANAEDLRRMDESEPRYDRLRLTEDRLRDIASDLRKVASLPSPLGKTLKHKVLPNGLELTRISVPFGELSSKPVPMCVSIVSHFA